jgi:hypothetical protein
MDHTTITIQGKDLTSTYGVYIVLINDADIIYYYVGQTGDALKISARGPFYRIAAHLGYSKSTQNQVYEMLKKVLKLVDRAAMEQWLRDKEISIHFFRTDDFVFMEHNHENFGSHIERRRKTLSLESSLLQLLEGQTDKVRLNRAPKSYKNHQDSICEAEKIIESLGLRS